MLSAAFSDVGFASFWEHAGMATAARSSKMTMNFSTLRIYFLRLFLFFLIGEVKP
ncbi:hypothetical protein GPEL0_01f3297 [Geoanaerobacter pelophilus]|uniref:Uncharacterized protein n=1 Tax=Geoanaerobacter pelophilus TaxID=60036 RepID=A0ABQ0MK60_9BACT|nr:hypothetical protein GPEL0_01f3297 [Geoanaerobacter pelophilus]